MAGKAKGGGKSRRREKKVTTPLDQAKKLGIRQVVDQHGKPCGDLPEPELSRDDLRRLYEMMVLVRALDQRGWTLQRSGRVEFWIPHSGLEGTHIAATMAFAIDDWIFMGYRHPGTMLIRGAPLVQLFAQFFGRRDEPFKGRRLPTVMGDRQVNVVPQTTQVGSLIPHACGVAWAAKIRGDETRVLAIFGDGATSRGEFHSAMNFAGVHKPPVVFLCENNGWAISTPNEMQTGSATFAEKGDAYGVCNLRVDGNDALAVYSVVSEARELAPREGATLIEAVTYRMGFHTSSDNPDLYRTEEDVAAWEPWDPLKRMRGYLEYRGFWSDEEETALWARCKDELQAAIDEAEAMELPDPSSMFDDTFAELTWMLEEQKAALLDDLEGD